MVTTVRIFCWLLGIEHFAYTGHGPAFGVLARRHRGKREWVVVGPWGLVDARPTRRAAQWLASEWDARHARARRLREDFETEQAALEVIS